MTDLVAQGPQRAIGADSRSERPGREGRLSSIPTSCRRGGGSSLPGRVVGRFPPMALLGNFPRRLTYANVVATLAAVGAAVALAVVLTGHSATRPTSGPPIPSVLGQPLTAARTRIASAAGSVPVKVTTRLVKSNYPIPGRVIMQSPGAGTRLGAGMEVTLGVSVPASGRRASGTTLAVVCRARSATAVAGRSTRQPSPVRRCRRTGAPSDAGSVQCEAQPSVDRPVGFGGRGPCDGLVPRIRGAQHVAAGPEPETEVRVGHPFPGHELMPGS